VRGFDRLLGNRVQNFFEHAIEILQYLIVPEAQNEIATGFQIFSPAQILCKLISVLPTIKLDYELGIRTTEVDNETVQRHLPPKFPSVQSPIAEPEPKDAFGIRLVSSQAPRDLNC
jgi:hypothetical protein